MVDADQDILDRNLVAKVAEVLMERTQKGTCRWSETAREGEFLATIGRQSFLVSRDGSHVGLRTKGPELEHEWVFSETEESAETAVQQHAYQQVGFLHDLVDERLGHPYQERGNDRLRHSLELLTAA